MIISGTSFLGVHLHIFHCLVALNLKKVLITTVLQVKITQYLQ